MQAWIVNAFGAFEKQLKWEQRTPPSVTGEATLIRVRAAGINFLDILSISGKYQIKPELPFTPGVEVAGDVIEAGPSSRFKQGDRVMSYINFGGFAEYALCPDESTFLMPDGMPYRQAAAFQITYQTSYFGLVHRGRLKAGETLLVHAGAGGVGSAAIQIGKALGARVISTAGNAGKLEIAKQCGADHLIDYTGRDFVQELKDLTDGRGADVIYDPVGGDVFEQSTRCIAWEGRLIVVGFAQGKIPTIAVNRILLKNFSVVGLHWGPYRTHDPEKVSRTQQSLYEMYAEDRLHPVVYGDYSLEQLPEALASLQSRESYGKIVLAG